MIRTSRRSVVVGAGLGMLAAAPMLPKLAPAGWRYTDTRILLHDPALQAGARFAAAGGLHGVPSLAIEGDRIRFARQVIAARPALIAGISRQADLLLMAEVAREAGYTIVAQLEERMGCTAARCSAGWHGISRLGHAAGKDWPEALAAYASGADTSADRPVQASAAKADAGLVMGWVLSPAA